MPRARVQAAEVEEQAPARPAWAKRALPEREPRAAWMQMAAENDRARPVWERPRESATAPADADPDPEAARLAASGLGMTPDQALLLERTVRAPEGEAAAASEPERVSEPASAAERVRLRAALEWTVSGQAREWASARQVVAVAAQTAGAQLRPGPPVPVPAPVREQARARGPARSSRQLEGRGRRPCPWVQK